MNKGQSLLNAVSEMAETQERFSSQIRSEITKTTRHDYEVSTLKHKSLVLAEQKLAHQLNAEHAALSKQRLECVKLWNSLMSCVGVLDYSWKISFLSF